MRKYFNTEGPCNPNVNYMVNLEERLKEIEKLVDRGKYFSINRARQYGKTTVLCALAQHLQEKYTVIELDFQLLSHADFENEPVFVAAFVREILLAVSDERTIPKNIRRKLEEFSGEENSGVKLAALFACLSEWCSESEKPMVLIIDEVDSASNNQVFLDFLAQLRGYYIHRQKRPIFQSVILAGVYDVKNLKSKLRSEDQHRLNSPWNIAADFNVDLSFSAADIARMLSEYESDHTTGMDLEDIAELIYDYTSGYPFLVSRICQILEERLAGSDGYPSRSEVWTRTGILDAVKILLTEQNTLFESLINKLTDYPELNQMLYGLLFTGREIPYTVGLQAVENARMFGFVKINKGIVAVANRIFETLLYNWFLTLPKVQDSQMYKLALQDKNQFVQFGRLNMDLVLEKFVEHFDDLYGDQSVTFYEEDGRRYFLLYLRPIINGVGNYYIESRTRNMERTDIIVDYRGEQFVIEMKIWKGDAYHSRGEQQLMDYLKHYHLNKGYMLSFNFNKKKQIGVKRITLGNRVLVEAIV